MSEPQSGTKNESLRHRKVLVVDDHKNIRVSLRLILEGEGVRLTEAESIFRAEEYLFNTTDPKPFDAILLDMRLPDGHGLDLLKKLKDKGLSSRVIVISGEGTLTDAFQATQMGAFDYIEKPFGQERILVTLGRLLEFHRVSTSKKQLEEQLQNEGILGEHPKILECLRLAQKIAPTSGRVLIFGESGTGKELLAKNIHRLSSRSDKPLIKVNCAAIPQSLIESELFGHEKGAFTGAIKSRKGVFEQADGGTLLLDEIGELSLDVQAKILRALQSGEIQKVGSESTLKVDVRLIAATHRDLKEMVEENLFREDLFYRLNVLTLQLPPLRERTSDIALIAKAFLKEACREHSLGEKHLSEEALQQLSEAPWPGNIRQLKNVIEKAAILSDEPLIESFEDLPPRKGHGVKETSQVSNPTESETMGGMRPSNGGPQTDLTTDTPEPKAKAPSDLTDVAGETAEGLFYLQTPLLNWHDFHEQVAKSYIKYALRKSQGNISVAARTLCLERAYLHRLMKKHGIHRDFVVLESSN